MRGLTAFDRRLAASSPAPLAVAFSGGGDSLALLKFTLDWARPRGRRVVVLTVDHRLQAAGAAWTEACRWTAARLGADFRALSWDGEKPATGLPAAARAARHRLLADAAREAGAAVILMGHTADDVLEAAAMRAAGSTVPDPREWSPSPAWPEGRGVFILRPLLGVRREALRDWLRAEGETWIEDPANADMRFARSRARHLQRGRGTTRDMAEEATANAASAAFEGGAWGVLSIPRGALDPAHVAAACLCAAGTARPPRGDRLARLVERLKAREPFTATLAGARIEADAAAVRFMRDAGETARGGLAPLVLRPGAPAVWDGRYEIVADRPLTVRALKGLAAGLSPAEREALKAVPAAARPALPAIANGTPACPILAGAPGVRLVPLALERLMAATGRVEREPLPHGAASAGVLH